MARPHKSGLEYFNMDCSFEQDPKIERLDFKFGNDGIAIFTRILARVFATGGKFNITENDKEIYASKFKVSYERLNEILSYMREINLFPTENFLSNSVKKRLKKIQTDRARKREYHSNKHKNKDVTGKVLDVQNTAKTALLDPKVKESKVKESKVKESKVNILFSEFWNLYDKKRGDKDKLEAKWNKLTDADRQQIMDYIPKYKIAEPNKQFRKDPKTFLNNKSWNDELIGTTQPQTRNNINGLHPEKTYGRNTKIV